jgi:CheY-like chemotaxis protein
VSPPPETVQSEEIRALFAQGAPVLFANVAVGSVLVAALWTDVSPVRSATWLVAIGLVSATRAWLHARYQREKPDASELAVWGRRFVFGSIISGSLWGTAGVAFFASGHALSQVLLTLAVGGMATAAAGSLACHLPAFYAFFALSLTPLTLRALFEGDRLHLGMGALLVVFGIGMLRVAHNNYRTFRRAFELVRENSDLLERLSVSRLELQETNRTLEERVLERTRAFERQSAALREAQRLEVTGRLAGGLAHDFNSLLTVVINNAAQLRDTRGLDEQSKLAADETLQAGERGAALIRQLLAFSRSRPAAPRVFQLNGLVEEWRDLLARLLGQSFETAVELSEKSTHVNADPAQIEQLLVNLVASARTAMPNGGRLLLATRTLTSGGADALPPGNYVQLSVSHPSRPEVAPGERPDPTEHSRATVIDAVRAMARQVGGGLFVDSSSQGTLVRVLFPLVSDSASPPSTRRGEARSARGQFTILVVDDEPTLRSVIRRSLVREGYEVIVAEDGPRALEVAGSTPRIDLLITDVVMPSMTGIELARAMLGTRPDLEVLFISGFTFEEAVPPKDLTGAAAYLPKPFEIQALLGKVSELLAARDAEESLRESG